METDREKIISYVRGKLDERRFMHSVNTAKEAVLLAGMYGADEDKAYIAGMLHDVAKGLSGASLIKLAAKRGVETDEFERSNPELLHGKIGAAMVSSELGVDDEDILSAIRWHTTGHKNMTLLEKIIYLADIIEPGRNFAETDELRRLAYKDIDAAMLKGLWHVMSFVKRRGLTLHPNSVEAYEHIKELEEKNKFEV